MRRFAFASLLLLCAPLAEAFCGFYVARVDAKLFNRASKVVLARDGERTVLTMANDYEGDPKDFAIVVPVPTIVKKDQVRVAEPAAIDHVDAWSAPRLVEYHDPDPCAPPRELYETTARPSAGAKMSADEERRAKSLGVTIEASYTVGEYDILILSATQSSGLETWLRENGYRIPAGASEVLGSYLRQGMHFFVAKVNLQERPGGFLRPLQVRYDTPRFMLPIRLGMVNADGPQELFVFALSQTGRVETTNYRTVRLPTGTNVPGFVQDEFTAFYKDLFTTAWKKEGGRAVFLEYAWDSRGCDPCASDPPSTDDLAQLGAPGGAFVTRLHLRYDNASFPSDLVLQETGDRASWQARYVIQRPWTGPATCEAGVRYKEQLAKRQAKEAEDLAGLTGWDVTAIRKRMGLGAGGDGFWEW